MKLVLSWMKDYITIDASVDEIAAKLFDIGFEVEEIISCDDGDTVFDVSVGANRPDCACVYGLCLELSAAFRVDIKPLDIAFTPSNEKTPPVKISSKDCFRYTAAVCDGVKIAPSPLYIADRLTKCGIRPINNAVDITNYVLLEVGQPMHAFDMRYVDKGIDVRVGKKGEKITALNGVEYAADSSITLITSGGKAVAVAGVIGGEYSSVFDDTKTILLESAVFARSAVRRASRKLGLRTDSSARFEKGVGFFSAKVGLERALTLFEQTGTGITASAISDEMTKKPKKQAALRVDFAKIEALLGIKLDCENAVDILRRLRFEVSGEGRKVSVTPPYFREDIESYACVAEEIIRFVGYDKLEGTMLKNAVVTRGGLSLAAQNINAVKQILLGAGFFEAYSYSFIPQNAAKRLGLLGEEARQIEIENPLSGEFAFMRTQAAFSMLNSLRLNLSRKNKDIKLFELARVYRPKALPLDCLPVEADTLCIGFAECECDFYSLKELVGRVLDMFGVEYSLKNSTVARYNKNGAADVFVGENYIGSFGEVDIETALELEIEQKVFLAELDLSGFIGRERCAPSFAPLPKFMPIMRDLALLVDESVLGGSLIDYARELAGELCKGVEIFDIYRGKQIPKGLKSVAMSFEFNADYRLTDAEINEVIARVSAGLDERYGAKQRG